MGIEVVGELYPGGAAEYQLFGAVSSKGGYIHVDADPGSVGSFVKDFERAKHSRRQGEVVGVPEMDRYGTKVSKDGWRLGCPQKGG